MSYGLPGLVSLCDRVNVPPSPPKMNQPLLGTNTLATPAAVGTSKSDTLKKQPWLRVKVKW